MSNQPPPARGQPAVDIVRGFRATLVIIGVLYVLMAASMLVRGVGVMRDFGVSPALVASPVLEDFFLFFYQGEAVRVRVRQTLKFELSG